MRILHVITTLDRGGAENHLVSLMDRQRQSHEIAVAYLKGEGQWQEGVVAKGISAFPLGLVRYGDPLPVLRLRKLFAQWKPDLIHSHLPPAELYTRLALLGRKSSPWIVTKHLDGPFIDSKGLDWFGGWVSKRADATIAISNAVAKDMRSKGFFAEGSPLEVIHYGIETEPYDRIEPAVIDNCRKRWGIRSGEVVFGTMARLVPQKSIETLLQAFKALSERSLIPVKLMVVGSGPLERALKGLAEELGIGERVIWTGKQSDVPSLMNVLDVFVLSSVYEGFGLVLLEAMAAARPIVASRVSAIPEVVLEGETGLLVEPRNPSALCECMLRMLNGELRNKMGLAGRGRVERVFGMASMVEKTQAVYNYALNQRVAAGLTGVACASS